VRGLDQIGELAAELVVAAVRCMDVPFGLEHGQAGEELGGLDLFLAGGGLGGAAFLIDDGDAGGVAACGQRDGDHAFLAAHGLHAEVLDLQ
jgi:hypothetical protein